VGAVVARALRACTHGLVAPLTPPLIALLAVPAAELSAATVVLAAFPSALLAAGEARCVGATRRRAESAASLLETLVPRMAVAGVDRLLVRRAVRPSCRHSPAAAFELAAGAALALPRLPLAATLGRARVEGTVALAPPPFLGARVRRLVVLPSH